MGLEKQIRPWEDISIEWRVEQNAKKEARDWWWIIVGPELLERQVQNAKCSFFRCFNRRRDSVSFGLKD